MILTRRFTDGSFRPQVTIGKEGRVGFRGFRRRVGPRGAGCQSFGVASLYRYLATAPRSAAAPAL